MLATLHFIFSGWVLAYFDIDAPERIIIVLMHYFKLDSESEASSSEIGELALQSTNSYVDNQEDCNKQRLLVDSDKTCKENSSSQEAEVELEIFARDAAADSCEITDEPRNCCGCESLQCTRFGCCRCFRNSKIAILLR